MLGLFESFFGLLVPSQFGGAQLFGPPQESHSMFLIQSPGSCVNRSITPSLPTRKEAFLLQIPPGSVTTPRALDINSYLGVPLHPFSGPPALALISMEVLGVVLKNKSHQVTYDSQCHLGNLESSTEEMARPCCLLY
jgi:hypothetical protein